MTSPSVVRVGTLADKDEIWRLFRAGWKENGLFQLAPQKVEWFMDRSLNSAAIPPDDTGPRGVIGVIGPQGALEGLAFVIIGEYWYSYDKHLEELIVLVDQEHRRSNHAKSLVAWMKSQVDATGLPLVTGILSTSRTEAKCRLYQRMLPKIGEFFLYSPKGALMMPALVSTSS